MSGKRKNIPKALRQLVLEKYSNHCAYCGSDLDIKSLRVDHLIAVHRGGEDNIDNYMPACVGCNFYKSTLTIDEFRLQLQSLHERIAKPFIARLGMRYGIVELKPFDGKFYFEKLGDVREKTQEV